MLAPTLTLYSAAFAGDLDLEIVKETWRNPPSYPFFDSTLLA